MRAVLTFATFAVLLASAIPATAQTEPDPEANGACVHSVSTLRMCNDITRRWCITGGFANADFYEGQTCKELKDSGVY